MRNRLNDLEEAQKAQSRVTSHTEAERRLIEQGRRLQPEQVPAEGGLCEEACWARN